MHSDVAQAVGKIPLDLRTMGLDLASASGHKVEGPKGIGFLWIRTGVELTPLVRGGPQEVGLRAGTENVPGIVGLARAFELAEERREATEEHVSFLARSLLEGLRSLVAVEVHGAHPRVPHILNFSLPEIDAALLHRRLTRSGVCVSTGSACMSHSLEPSQVLLAIGRSEDVAKTSLRISFARNNTPAEVERVLGIIKDLVTEIQSAFNGAD